MDLHPAGTFESSSEERMLLGIPRAPRTPSQRAREVIYRYQGAQLALLLVGALFALIGTPTAVVFAWGLPGDIALAVAGQRATAHVVDTALDLNTIVNGQHPTILRYRYEVRGASYTGASSTRDRSLLATAKPGAEVAIEVLPSHPAWARVVGTTYSWLGWFSLPILAFPLLGWSIAGFAIRSNRREIRAFVDGTPIVATVTFAGEDVRTTINGQHPYQLQWEFEVAGARYRGSVSSLNREHLRDLLPRKQLVVLYDEMNPRINTLWID